MAVGLRRLHRPQVLDVLTDPGGFRRKVLPKTRGPDRGGRCCTEAGPPQRRVEPIYPTSRRRPIGAGAAIPEDDVTASNGSALNLRVVGTTRETDRVLALDLQRDNGIDLPGWEAGAHIDVRLPSGLVRQYSLCGDPLNRSTYRIAVLRDDAGRGGSVELHASIGVGTRLNVGMPRNHFPMDDGERYLFLAGGIGITPLLPMTLTAGRRGRPWTLLYVGRKRSSMAFAGNLAGRSDGRVRLLTSGDTGRPDLAAILSAVAADTLVYACGPASMLSDAETAAAQYGLADRLRLERFAAASAASSMLAPDSAFEVTLAQSGRRLHVPADRTLGSVLQAAGAAVSFSCEEGCCGTCETRVLAGVPDHRDCILSDREKAGNDRMMVCVGRALGTRLVLDL